ncbi:MAG: hypothetical protein CMJ58_22325 [Planctomycetaceae bacterium]|nr:hypothetical protein [Planctomycetaceae bacterium]
MADELTAIERERQLLADVQDKGLATRWTAYARLSGPGWVQSAITLGGGSLASALYLGVLGGYSLLWLQPFAMILGVIMLSTIGYVTLSTGERPFRSINRHVSPVLGWSWALAVAAANIIWSMPQHSLAYGVLSQNLLPADWFADGALLAGFGGKLLVAAVLLAICTVITWSYDQGGWGLRLYETVLKLVVAMIVLCFFGVVIKLATSEAGLPWGELLAGLIPDFGQFFRPADSFLPLLEPLGEAGSAVRDYWNAAIVAQQRDVIISAAATAVGINMTFMYPYSMLRKGWTKEFRGLARFDLATGMFIPFMLATGCVVIAAAARFHTQLPPGFEAIEGADGAVQLTVDESGPKFVPYSKLMSTRDTALGADAPAATDAERRLAAILVKRDAFDMAKALEPITGPNIANVVFGLGVLAMTLSTISVLMLISGTVVAEMFDAPPGGAVHKAGTLVAGVGGVLWPLFWQGDSQFYLAVVTSVFGFMLLPFAYITFAALLNNRSLLGEEMPRGGTRLVANALVFFAAAAATIGAVYMVWIKAGWIGIGLIAVVVVLTAMIRPRGDDTASA